MADQLLHGKDVAPRLGVSLKTLDDYADDGEIRYIDLARGGKNKRRRYTEEFIAEFLERRTRRDVKQCPSTGPKAPRTTTSTSGSNVLGFMAQRARRISEKQKA